MTSQDAPVTAPGDPVGTELARWGRVLLLETRGHRTGRRRVAAIGFVARPDGSHLVAAGEPGTAWARNLDADPACRISYADVDLACRAERLPPDQAAAAVVALILRYGTPAERLGGGPAFRLVPIARDGIDHDGRDPA